VSDFLFFFLPFQRVIVSFFYSSFPVTNAAGSLNPKLPVGTSMYTVDPTLCEKLSTLLSVVVVHDHIALPNLTGFNPLLGQQTDLSLPRFLPLSDAYSRRLRKLVFMAAHSLNLPETALAEGTYAWVSGPTYETPAEGRFLRAAGADVVGMSTVPEVLAAREMGIEVSVLSLVTNAVVIPEGYRSIREEVEAEVSPTAAPQQNSYQSIIFVARRSSGARYIRCHRNARGSFGSRPRKSRYNETSGGEGCGTYTQSIVS
jgi:purine-nucleoside phosphorylase